MLKRTLNLFSILGNSKSCLLLGPRGTGKSAIAQLFVKQHAPNHTLIDLLDREVYLQHVNSPGLFKSFLRTLPSSNEIHTVVVDEVQKLPELLDDVHLILEEQSREGHQQVRFILTGSSARKLKRGGANLLAGRAISLSLFPLNIEEVDFNLERALRTGLLPGFYLSNDDSLRELRSYADTYIREEVLQESLVRKVQSFEKFVDLAAQINAEPVNFAKIGKAAGISGNTTQTFFEILSDILLVSRIDAWTFSVREQIATAPKFYFFDCGVLNALRGELAVPLKPSGYRYGKLFETLVVNQILALSSYHEFSFKPYFWRTHTGQEVDLILARSPSDPPRAIEIKSEVTVQPADLRGLKAFKAQNESAKLYCLSQTTIPYESEGIRVLPWRTGIRTILEDDLVER